jgi:hypothetical protein
MSILTWPLTHGEADHRVEDEEEEEPEPEGEGDEGAEADLTG